jgi:SAM-dependent methyltransferase
MRKNRTREVVKKAYGRIAKEGKGCGCETCSPNTKEFAQTIGYSEKELNAIPAESNLGLSCGNPIASANLKEGDVVLDLGSGAGFDCFLAATKVGPNGKIVGVDMTPEMVEKARENAKKNKLENVEFKISEIENLLLEDNSVDVVISNCVINLSADKPKVFKEIYRVLKPGGRIAISDIALLKELPKKIQENVQAYVGCVAGAILIKEYQKIVRGAGLKDVQVTIKGTSACIRLDTKDPLGGAILDSLEENESLDDYVASVYVQGHK